MNERDTTTVIDRTLARGAVTASDPSERELEQLALALAAESAVPSAEFAAELDDRVRNGFPGGPGRSGWAERLRSGGAWIGAQLFPPRLPLLAGVASVLVALAVVVSLLGDDGGERQLTESSVDTRAPAGEPSALGREGSGEIVADEVATDKGAAGTALPLASPAPPVDRGFAPGKRERRIERTATLLLAAPGDELDSVASDIAAITDRYRGFVLRSELATGDGGATTGGSFELRIPAARLQPALSALAKLGEVRARTQTGDDVTSTFVTAAEQLEGARAERSSLLRRLAEADSDAETEAIRRRLDLNAGEINRLRSELRDLRLRTDYASVDVTLEERRGENTAAPGDGIGSALDDALDSMTESAELAIRVLGAVLPLALLATLLAFAARAARRRRREGALS